MSTNFSTYSDGVTVLFPNAINWTEPLGSVLEVLLDGVATSAYTRNVYDITLDSAAPEGTLITIHRVTQTVPLSNFNDGTGLTAENLEQDQQQQFDLIKEHQSDINVDLTDIRRDIGDVDYDGKGDLQTQIDTVAGSTGLPAGGDVGAVITKNSLTDGDASWDDFALSGYSNRFGEPWSELGLRATIDKILDLQYVGPNIKSFNGTSNSLREKGDVVVSITLNADIAKTVDDFSRVLFRQGGTTILDLNPPANVTGGTYSAPYSTPFSDNITFTVEVTDDGTSGGPTTDVANTSYSFVYPYYFGAGVPSISAAAVAGLTKDIRNSTANLNKTFTTSNGDVYYFAYPASYGALTSILDENGFEVIGSFTLRTENITGLDSNPVSYRIYESNNPVLAGTTNFTFIR